MSDYDELWELMETYNFEIGEECSASVICLICSRLMKSPYSSICGCQFCKSCIINYLKNTKKNCPGKRERCRKTLLEIEKTVTKDFKTCFDISKTVVKCPNNKCGFNNELDIINEHIRCCKMRPIQCPYLTLGCEASDNTGETISDHLLLEAMKHSQLLIEAVNNLNNDIDGLKQSEERKENEIRELKEELEVNKNFIEDQRCKINELKENERPNEEIINIKKILEVLRKEIKAKEERTLKEMEDQRQEMNELKKESEQSQKVNTELKDEIDRLRNETKTSQHKQCISEKSMKEIIVAVKQNIEDEKTNLEEMKQEIRIVKETSERKMEIDNLKKQFEKQCFEVNSLKTQVLKYSEEINKVSIVKTENILKVVYDFVWTINDFTNKKGEHFSNLFTTNNYKFCLRVWIGSDRLWLFVCVKKGERDDKAVWPLRHGIILSVLNQETATAYLSERYSQETYKDNATVFDKPMNDQDGRIGGLEILLSDVKTIRGLLIKDSLMLCCSLFPPSQ